MKARYFFTAIMALVLMPLFAHVSDGGPLASIAGKSNGVITTKAMLANPEIEACGRDVMSFTMTIVSSDKQVIQHNATGSNLNDRMIEALRSAQAGQKVYFENIKVKEKEGKELTLPNMTFTLK
ncbi:MAG: hypothetical protein HKN32_05000 [Flavobacteriales bacterium]|nr:hypothetical protein [Flavobacteriales bacterium]